LILESLKYLVYVRFLYHIPKQLRIAACKITSPLTSRSIPILYTSFFTLWAGYAERQGTSSQSQQSSCTVYL